MSSIFGNLFQIVFRILFALSLIYEVNRAGMAWHVCQFSKFTICTEAIGCRHWLRRIRSELEYILCSLSTRCTRKWIEMVPGGYVCCAVPIAPTQNNKITILLILRAQRHLHLHFHSRLWDFGTDYIVPFPSLFVRTSSWLLTSLRSISNWAANMHKSIIIPFLMHSWLDFRESAVRAPRARCSNIFFLTHYGRFFNLPLSLARTFAKDGKLCVYHVHKYLTKFKEKKK